MMLHHRHGNNLNGNDEADHGDGVAGGICHAGDVAVHHGVGSSKTGSRGHTTGECSHEVEHGNLEHEASRQGGNEHGNQCEGGTDAEQEQTAALEGGNEGLASRCAYFC